jgi:hypothetical protein
MTGDGHKGSLSFLGRQLPEGVVCRLVTIAQRSERPYDESEWAGALIVVEQGELELECLGGTRSCFATGSVLCFQRLGLRRLRNLGDEPLLLTAISRPQP